MIDQIDSLSDFDLHLALEFDLFRQKIADKSLEEAQELFVRLHLFPRFGWGVINVGTRQALARKDPLVLWEMLSRFYKLAFTAFGNFDENGIQRYSGIDYCGLVDVTLYTAPVGREYFADLFDPKRPLSKTGHITTKCVANLLVTLQNPEWSHREKALAQANKLLASKTPNKTDKAFVGFLLGSVEHDATACEAALQEFNAGYCKTDWGKHKPYTQPVFMYSLIALAELQGKVAVSEAVRDAVLGRQWNGIWREFSAQLPQLCVKEVKFSGDLAFLNDPPILRI